MNCDWCGKMIDFNRYYCIFIDTWTKRTFHDTKCLLKWVSNELGVSIEE